MIAIEITVHIRQRAQRYIHHPAVAAQVDTVFLHVERQRSRSGRKGRWFPAVERRFIVIVIIIATRLASHRDAQRHEIHEVIKRHRLFCRIHSGRLAKTRRQRVLRSSRLAHPDGSACHQHVLEVSHGDISHMRHILIVAQGNRRSRFPVVVHDGLRHLKRHLVRRVITRSRLLSRINRIVSTVHTTRQD